MKTITARTRQGITDKEFREILDALTGTSDGNFLIACREIKQSIDYMSRSQLQELILTMTDTAKSQLFGE